MIYLDFDGVMLAGQDYLAEPLAFPSARVELINRLLDHTDSKIVISSSWRRGDQGRNLMRSSGLWRRTARRTAEGKVCDWKTPFLSEDEDTQDSLTFRPLPRLNPNLSVRGQEIQAHIDLFGIQRYLILDDEAVLVGQFHIPINQYDGLTSDDIDCAIDLWNMQGRLA